MKRKILSVLCCVALALSFTGCGSGAQDASKASSADTSGVTELKESDTKAKSNIALGISFGQNVHPFFKAMQKGAEDAAKESGVELVVQSADSSVEKQTTQIENLVQSGVKAILLNPYDSAAVAPACQAALDKNIGIFTMDITVDGAEATSFIASDNVKIGEMLAQYIDEQLEGKGKIALLVDPSVSSLKDREKGFTDYIKANTQIEIVATQNGAIERTKSLESAETILQAHPDIQAFPGINENSALGIASAVKASGLKDIILTGVDATEDVMNGIKDGTLAIGVAQDPYQMGYESVKNAVKWINGETVEKEIKLECEYMTTDNIQEYIDREAQYLK